MTLHRLFIHQNDFLLFSDTETYNPNTHTNPELNKIWPVYKKLWKSVGKSWLLYEVIGMHLVHSSKTWRHHCI